MQVEILTLCDAATDCHGKLNLLGTFDVLNFSSFPWEILSFAIVARVRFDAEEGNRHEMEVVWLDADGEEVDSTGSREILLDHSIRRECGQAIWHQVGKTFFGPTEFSLQLRVDGVPIADTPLMIRQRGEEV